MFTSPKLIAGVALGAAGMYYLDPDRGRARRARGRDQAAARLRSRRREADQRARYEANREAGQRLVEQGAGRFRPVDDTAAAQHLKQVLAAVDAETADVVVEVADRVAVLRGQVASAADRDAIVDAVGGAEGIHSVTSYLHLPGETAPNKADALNAATDGSRGQS